MNVIPLDPNNLKLLVKEVQTKDVSMLARQKDNKSELLGKWFKAACVANPNEPTKSQVAVPVVQLEEDTVPQDVLDQLQAALPNIHTEQLVAEARLTVLLPRGLDLI